MRNLAIIFLLAIGGIVFFVLTKENIGSDPAAPTQQTVTTESETTADPASAGRYVEYSPEAFAAAEGQRRAIFFYASWCPTCRPSDAEFRSETSRIPEDVVLFRANYDTETELKERYGVTYQHTFVQVDGNGGAVARWNGGGLDELLANLQ